MGILEKNTILGSADASSNMIFFKDPIYFRITPLRVYITNNTINQSINQQAVNVILISLRLILTKVIPASGITRIVVGLVI